MNACATATTRPLGSVCVGRRGLREITRLDPQKNEAGHHWPKWLPGGRAVLFTVIHTDETWDDATIEVQDLTAGERQVLIQGGTQARYVRSGHIVYVRSGTLMAAPFDLSRRRLTGPPVPVVEDVAESFNGAGEFSVSRDGTLIYLRGVESGPLSFAWITRAGAVQTLAAKAQAYLLPRVSPDGNRIATWIASGAKCAVAVYDIGRHNRTRLTFADDNHVPVWSADGSRVVFQSDSPGPYELFWTRADGGAGLERLTHSAATDSYDMMMPQPYPARSRRMAPPWPSRDSPRKRPGTSGCWT